MKPILRNFIGPALAMTAGWLTMQWLIKPDKPATQVSAPVALSSASSASSLKEPVLTLPEFSLKDRNGTLTSIRSWPGKSLIINFWATWCEPCRREMPLLLKLQKDHAADGFQVVGIAIDFRDAVLKYADSMHISYPLLIGEQDGFAAADAFGIDASGLPFTVFTDQQGDIIVTHLGELHPEQVAMVLDTIKQVNSGQLTANAARTRVNLGLSSSK